MPMGSRKGSSFERAISKVISLWWSQGKDPNCLYRTHGSGSMHKRRANVHTGDIGPLTPAGMGFPLHCELKHYRNLNWSSLLSAAPSKFVLFQWFEKASQEADGGHPRLIPCLIVKVNHMKTAFIVDKKLYEALEFFFKLRLTIEPRSGLLCMFSLNNQLFALDFERVMRDITPSTFMRIYADWYKN